MCLGNPAKSNEPARKFRVATCSRREAMLSLISLAGAASIAWQDGRAARGADDPNESRWIDAHTHVWTADTARYPLAAGYRRDEMRPASFTLDEFFAHARPEGVTRAVLIQMSFYGFDQRYLLAELAASQGACVGVAVIDDEATDPTIEMRRLAALGVRGFRIYPRNRPIDHWLKGDGMAAMWRCAAETGLAICPLISPEALPALDVMCERFPETKTVVDHFARIGVDGMLRDGDIDQLCRLARHQRTYVKTSAYYALGRKLPPYDDLAPLIRRVYQAYGPERLMWASDCPFQVVDHTYRDSISLVRERLDFLSAADKDWLLRKTAERVFFTQ
jgi:predicted TIM-barrel fold metal-dependent hydrolase